MAVLALTRWIRVIGSSCIAAMLFCMQAHAEEQSLQLYEQKIKAGLIYNFLKYTEWPIAKMPGTADPIVVCIFGQDPFDGYLQPMADRTVKQRSITIRVVNKTPDTSSCHLLFVGSEQKESWLRLHSFLFDKSVLTIGDWAGFADAGGMIQFGKRGDHIYMELNMEAIVAAHLRVYENLVKMSTTMHPATHEGR